MITLEKLKKLEKVYANYLIAENLKPDDYEAHIMPDETIGIAYTTIGPNEEYEVQVSYDTKTEEDVVSIHRDGWTWTYRSKNPVDGIIMDLDLCDFNDFYRFAHECLEKNLGSLSELIHLDNECELF